MADNVVLNSMSGGETAATDQVGTPHYQEMKLVDGTKGAITPVAVDVGVKANAIRTAPASDITDGTYIGDIKFGEALPAGTAEIGKLAAGVAEIGNVKNSGTFAVQADTTLQAETTKVIGTVNVAAAQTIAVTNAGTFATQSTLQAGTAEIGKLAAGVAEIGNVKNSGTFATQATLQAGSAAIGKLAANSGVDIGDVDVTSISAGTNLVGDVGISGARTSGGTTIFRSIDLDEGALEVVKASAGQLYWIHAVNLAATPVYVKIYNAASGTIGTGNPVLTFPIPSQGDANGAGFNFAVPNGIAFATGISIGASTGVADADTGAPATNSCIVNLGFA